MPNQKNGLLPSFEFINEEIPIDEIVDRPGLKRSRSGKVHCWRLGNHAHGDRDASVGIDRKRNRLKCFVCDRTRPGEKGRELSPIKLVCSVLAVEPPEAGKWIEERFPHVEKVSVRSRRTNTCSVPFLTFPPVGMKKRDRPDIEKIVRSPHFPELGTRAFKIMSCMVVSLKSKKSPVWTVSIGELASLLRCCRRLATATMRELEKIGFLAVDRGGISRWGKKRPSYRMTWWSSDFQAWLNGPMSNQAEEDEHEQSINTGGQESVPGTDRPVDDPYDPTFIIWCHQATKSLVSHNVRVRYRRRSKEYTPNCSFLNLSA